MNKFASLDGRPVSIIAYFSMEVGLDPEMPTYSGGLGILAGDTLRAAADQCIPLVGVTLLHRKGYYKQRLDKEGNQTESPAEWNPRRFLEPVNTRASVTIEGRQILLRAWRYTVRGCSGYSLPVYFLDTALRENSAWDQRLTDHLYGGDARYRLCQEAVLGLGGIALLRRMGHTDVSAFHMNEGHSALLGLALLEERLNPDRVSRADEQDIEYVRRQCVFTTHTPVPEGHDKFPMDLVGQVLGPEPAAFLSASRANKEGSLNMTSLALLFSRYVNGVSHRHEEISQSMFPGYPINSITNGVHAVTWTSPPFQMLFDRHFAEWRLDNHYLRYAVSIPLEEIRLAHAQAKASLFEEVARKTDVRLDPQVMTVGFARRAAAYKRADLLFADLDRLRRIRRQTGPLQVVFAGKAHPRDESGKALIRHIFEASAALRNEIPVVYLEGYGISLAKHLVSGVDLWLNNPQKPQEASGTSGMKAALNGVPSLSVLDGWWIEGHVEGMTGWSIGESQEKEADPKVEIDSLYTKLDEIILPLFYGDPDGFARVMRSCVALNGSFFNAQRMMTQYLKNAYLTGNGNGSGRGR